MQLIDTYFSNTPYMDRYLTLGIRKVLSDTKPLV